MILDLVVIGAITLFAVLGAIAGALQQAVRLAAAAGAGLLGRPLGALLAPVLVAHTGLPATIAAPLAVAGACLFLYVVLHFVGRRIARAFTEDREVRALDRGAGAFFGALQAVVIAWVLVSIVVGLEEKVKVPLGGEGSLAAKVAREHNFFVALRGAQAAAPVEASPPAAAR